jgi:hypothetical protein
VLGSVERGVSKILVCLQNGVTALEPVVTGADGTAVIPLNVEDTDTSTDYSHWQVTEYLAAAQTPDGQLMVVDLRQTALYAGPATVLQSEVVLDRTVVGLGAPLRFWEVLCSCNAETLEGYAYM